MTKDLLQFDRYIDHELTGEDLFDFERRLSNDDEFRWRFELHRQERTDVEASFLREEMSSWTLIEHKKDQGKWKLSPVQRALLLLCVLVLLAILVFRKKAPNIPMDTPQQMFVEYFQPDPGLPTLMQGADANLFMDGMVLYKIGEYELALDKWNAITQPSDTLSYYLGQTAIARKKWEVGHQYLSSIPRTSPFFLESQWFKLLLSLRENQMDSARTFMKLLEAAGHRKAELEDIKEVIGKED